MTYGSERFSRNGPCAQGVIVALLLMLDLVRATGALATDIELTAYTDDASVFPNIVCGLSVTDPLQGQQHSFPFKRSGVAGVGAVAQGECGQFAGLYLDAKYGLNLQVRRGDATLQDERYLFDIASGRITEGNDLLAQKSVFFAHGGLNYAMNYGVSRFQPPVGNQAYVYVGRGRSGWMGDLLAGGFSDITLNRLVLPGAHDAGMYLINEPELVALASKIDLQSQLCKDFPGICLLLSEAVTPLLMTPLTNFAVTQKDSTADQLRLGVRFFDFRPAVLGNAAPSDLNTFHIHSFIPGVRFETFLSDINTFLKNNKHEVVVIQITSSGIDGTYFTPLSQNHVTAFLNRHITSTHHVLPADPRRFFATRLQELVAKNGRVIVLYQPKPAQVNDSYDAPGNPNTTSLTDPQLVLKALGSTLDKCRAPDERYDYTVLQLQDTGSEALENYVTTIEQHLGQWAYDLLESDTGSVLQATKPIFDHATYNWLANKEIPGRLSHCAGLVVLLNDFVDIALVSHAVGLTRSLKAR